MRRSSLLVLGTSVVVIRAATHQQRSLHHDGNSHEGDPSTWYNRYKSYHPYCSTPSDMSGRAIPPLNPGILTKTKLVQATAIIRHGARTPYSGDMQCWDGYWINPETGVWDCDLSTMTAPPPPLIVHDEERGVVGAPDAHPEAMFLFEKRYDALRNPPLLANELNGTCQEGQLLLRGYEQELVNGQHLRNAYVFDENTQKNHAASDNRMRLFDLTRDGANDVGIAKPFEEPNLYYRADDEQRTLMSGQVLLRGLFGQDFIKKAEKDETPVIVTHTADYSKDILTGGRNCPRLEDLKEEAENSPEFKAFNTSKEATLLRKFVKEELGTPFYNFGGIDCLMTTMCTDRPLPKSLDDYNGINNGGRPSQPHNTGDNNSGGGGGTPANVVKETPSPTASPIAAATTPPPTPSPTNAPPPPPPPPTDSPTKIPVTEDTTTKTTDSPTVKPTKAPTAPITTTSTTTSAAAEETPAATTPSPTSKPTDSPVANTKPPTPSPTPAPTPASTPGPKPNDNNNKGTPGNGDGNGGGKPPAVNGTDGGGNRRQLDHGEDHTGDSSSSSSSSPSSDSSSSSDSSDDEDVDYGTDLFERLYDFEAHHDSFHYRYNDGAHSKLAMAPLWAEIMANIHPIINDNVMGVSDYVEPTNFQAPKLALISGHDTTLMPLMATLGEKVWDGDWTPYASMLVIEIHKILGDSPDPKVYPGNKVFRLLYNGETITSKMDGCPSDSDLCDIGILLRRVHPFASVKRDCYSNRTNSDKETLPELFEEMEHETEEMLTKKSGIALLASIAVICSLMGSCITFTCLTGRLPCLPSWCCWCCRRKRLDRKNYDIGLSLTDMHGVDGNGSYVDAYGNGNNGTQTHYTDRPPAEHEDEFI